MFRKSTYPRQLRTVGVAQPCWPGTASVAFAAISFTSLPKIDTAGWMILFQTPPAYVDCGHKSLLPIRNHAELHGSPDETSTSIVLHASLAVECWGGAYGPTGRLEALQMSRYR